VAIALLANAIATGCMLYAIITTLGPISGAHFNSAVTLAFFIRGEIDGQEALAYVDAQVLGVWAAHLMFDLPILQTSLTMHRPRIAQWSYEVTATFGLLFIIFGGLASRALYHRRLLVHLGDQFREPCGDDRAKLYAHVCRYFYTPCAGVYPSPDRRCPREARRIDAGQVNWTDRAENTLPLRQDEPRASASETQRHEIVIS